MSEIKKFKSNAMTYQLVRIKTDLPKVHISKSRHVHEFVHPLFKDCMETNERVVMLVLNQANNVMGFKIIAEGTMTGALVDLRLCVRYALEAGGVAVILVHNHPSGSIMPSEHDRSFTQKLKEAFEMFDIHIIDHVIVADKAFYSFADEGIL